MKITVDVECSPAEARSFLGLPDLTPLHELYIAKASSLMTDGLTPIEVQKMVQSWLPGMSEGFETWRRAVADLARPKSS